MSTPLRVAIVGCEQIADEHMKAKSIYS